MGTRLGQGFGGPHQGQVAVRQEFVARLLTGAEAMVTV